MKTIHYLLKKTKKARLLMFLMLALPGMQLQADQIELNIPPLRFAGVHPLQGEGTISHGVLVMHNASAGNWNYYLYNNQLHPVREGKLETPRHSFVNRVSSSGHYTLISMVANLVGPSATYIVLDDRGEEIGRQIREQSGMLRRGEHFYPYTQVHPSHGFLIAEATGRGQDSGLLIEHIDDNLTTVWQTNLYIPGGSSFVVDIISGENRIFVLEGVERWGNTIGTRLHCLDALDGQLKYSIDMTDGRNSFYPTALRPMPDGSIALAGTYFQGTRINARQMRGIFFTVVSPRGEDMTVALHSWRSLRPLLRTPVPDWFFSIMPDVYIHSLDHASDGGFVAVAELYRYSGEISRPGESRNRGRETSRMIRLMDFMLLGFEGSGDLVFTERIEKPHMALRLEEGSGSGSLSQAAASGPLRRAVAMKRSGAFAYRFHQISEEGELMLAFSSYEAKTHYAYLANLNNPEKLKRIGLTHAKPRLFSVAEMIATVGNPPGFGFALTEMNTRNFNDAEAYWRGILPTYDASMILYEYMPLGGSLKINLISFD